MNISQFGELILEMFQQKEENYFICSAQIHWFAYHKIK